VAHAVKIAGVEHVHPAVNGGVDGGDALGVIAGPLHAGHAHAAKDDGKNFKAAAA
jgi:hypothetical protein